MVDVGNVAGRPQKRSGKKEHLEAGLLRPARKTLAGNINRARSEMEIVFFIRPPGETRSGLPDASMRFFLFLLKTRAT